MINPYATLQEFKNYVAVRGQHTNLSTDTFDDEVIESLIEGVSRWFDNQTHRTFYPRYETRYFDVPVYINSPRMLFLDDDLLEVVKITNGDGNEVLPAVYYLEPKNRSPHYGIRIIGPSAIFWIFNGIGSIEKVISVNALWGYHKYYEQRAWKSIDTLAADLTINATTLTLTSGNLLVGQIVKIGTELFNVISISTTGTGGVGDPYVYTATVEMRGDNGSTAATHTTGSAIYLWNVEPEIKSGVLEFVHNLYMIRNGQASSGKFMQTSAGLVLQPSDVPEFAITVAKSFVRPL